MQSAASISGESYKQDLRMVKILGAASLVALALAAFGIYVLSAYTVQRSRREIVIRKLYGASNGAIARRLGREFGLTVAAGRAHRAAGGGAGDPLLSCRLCRACAVRAVAAGCGGGAGAVRGAGGDGAPHGGGDAYESGAGLARLIRPVRRTNRRRACS